MLIHLSNNDNKLHISIRCYYLYFTVYFTINRYKNRLGSWQVTGERKASRKSVAINFKTEVWHTFYIDRQ